MKLVIAIVQAYDADRLLRAIASAGLRATKITRSADSPDEQRDHHDGPDTADVPTAIAAIKENCQARVEVQMDVATAEFDEWFPAGVHEVTVGGAVVFTMPLSEIVRIFPDTMDRKGVGMGRARQTLRNYWSGLLIAAAVSYGQLHDDGYTDVRAAQQHPYVWIAPEEWHPRFHPGEMIGQNVITLPLERVTTPSLN